jgi:hypothetical protein
MMASAVYLEGLLAIDIGLHAGRDLASQATEACETLQHGVIVVRLLPILGSVDCPGFPFMAVKGTSEILNLCCCAAKPNRGAHRCGPTGAARRRRACAISSNRSLVIESAAARICASTMRASTTPSAMISRTSSPPARLSQRQRHAFARAPRRRCANARVR